MYETCSISEFRCHVPLRAVLCKELNDGHALQSLCRDASHPLPNRNRAAWRTRLRQLSHSLSARDARKAGRPLPRGPPACRVAFLSSFFQCMPFGNYTTYLDAKEWQERNNCDASDDEL
ncbi:hypothetical protein LX32DRAFT_285982 [Colletotrichum zoysiae]|uniref:Uncharacterized protein n=1 Tax=Colletotrichum zoysiae TaxID=1216348 RepID=A0AAD9H3M7_9PEZI|nr:hypothetical protein LX32DRAFT_285982 [Colletotrichum zoysiae]